MKLSELVTELRENLLRDASTLKDGPPDYYWDDATLVRYINDAQRRFARRTFCIADDTTPEVVRVPVKAGTSIYQLHPSVLHVVSARFQDAATDLVYFSHPVGFSTINPYTETVDGLACHSSGGAPMRYSTDEGLQVDDGDFSIRMLLEPKPGDEQVGKSVYLRVRRLPLNRFVAGKDTKSEIPEDWQLDTLEWAAWRALRNWDLDAEDRKKAEAHKTRFNEAVLECRHEVQMTKMHQPPVWHFGQNGFSYVR